jgi:hypothetical protein
MDYLNLALLIVSGVVAANLVGAVAHGSTGLGNTLAGIVGGTLGGQIVQSAMGLGQIALEDGLDMGVLVSEAAAAAVGGVILALLLGFLGRVAHE